MATVNSLLQQRLVVFDENDSSYNDKHCVFCLFSIQLLLLCFIFKLKSKHLRTHNETLKDGWLQLTLLLITKSGTGSGHLQYFKMLISKSQPFFSGLLHDSVRVQVHLA